VHAGRARIGVINRAINLAIKPTSDWAQWGVADRWSAPLETLTSGRGDCEDYAIAKYVALSEAGIGEADLRIVIVRDLGLGEDHAVLAARDGEKWLLLDNRRLALLEDNELQRGRPLFALNRDGVREFTPAALAEQHIAAAAPSSLGEFVQ
jgi:predicted transglutaminase-like cysteine proteinase